MGRKAVKRKSVEVSALDADGGLSEEHWILIQTRNSEEKGVRAELRREGFEVYLPLRLGRRKDGSPVSVAFFPRYLFARATADVERWQVLFSIEGVRQVMGNGGRPVGIRDRFVQGLKRRELDGYLQLGLAPGKAPCPFDAGDAVMIDGVVPGLFERVDGRRVTCLISAVSSDSRVAVDLSRVALRAGVIK